MRNLSAKTATGHEQTVTYSPDRTFEGPLHAKTFPIPKECNSAKAVVGALSGLLPQRIPYRA